MKVKIHVCVCVYVKIQETGVLQWNNAKYITHPWVVFFNCFFCNLSSFFWKLVLKGLKTDYSNKFMQMTNPFKLQMRTIYFPIVNTRNIIKINQKSEVLGNITAKDYSPILDWNPDAIVQKVLIHTTIGLPNIREYGR